MIKTTIAVMASLMLVACGKGDDPKDANPDGQKADNVVSQKVEDAKVDPTKVADAELIPKKPEAPMSTPPQAPNLTLTYFSLAG
ncbi:MAG: hypothetical protein ACI89X_003203 [Planctomycetota bacterium]|jgi:hypothetical protein